ncbi:hypothetical protein AC1031_014946 [Aphanomyces cochlioides]|nr:hypothetical protein AC1031_014946 [Aphanomyces cochlioides]
MRMYSVITRSPNVHRRNEALGLPPQMRASPATDKLFSEVQKAYTDACLVNVATVMKTKRAIKPDHHRYDPSHYMAHKNDVIKSSTHSFGEIRSYWPKSLQEVTSNSFISDNINLPDLRDRLSRRFPLEAMSTERYIHPWDESNSPCYASSW